MARRSRVDYNEKSIEALGLHRIDASQLLNEKAVQQQRIAATAAAGGGTGDMTKATYDPDGDGSVALADQLKTNAYTSGTLPGASAAWLGKFVRLYDVGYSEELLICLRKADGSYAWAVVALAP